MGIPVNVIDGGNKNIGDSTFIESSQFSICPGQGASRQGIW